MIDAIVIRVKGFLLHPVEAFRQSRNDKPVVVFTYFGALLLFNAILSALIAVVFRMRDMQLFYGMSSELADLFMFFFMTLAGSFVHTFIFILIIAAWIHVWVYLFGGRKGVRQTIKTIMYGNTPDLLLGWIPYIGLIFTLWSLVLSTWGIHEIQEISTGKAILAVAFAVIFLLIFIILLVTYLMTSNMVFSAVPVLFGN